MTGSKGCSSRAVRVVGALLVLAALTNAEFESSGNPSSSGNATRPVTLSSIPAERSESTVTSSSGLESAREEARREKGMQAKSPWRSSEWRGGRGRPQKDSYLEALRLSRATADSKEGVVRSKISFQSTPKRREYVQKDGPVYVPGTEYERGEEPVEKVGIGRIAYGSYSSQADSYSFGPSDSYSLPDKSPADFKDDGYPHGAYGPPRNTYGPPSKTSHQNPYGVYSTNLHSPPHQAYGPPSPSLSYGYGTPYGHSETSHILELPSIDIGWPFALKLNAFTLAKILLKLVIFKMIVKFIAVICLLLFIPKLEIIKQKKKKGVQSEEEEEEEGRADAAGFRMSNYRLNELASMVLSAVEKYEAATRSARSGPESGNDYVKLLESYAFEELQREKKTS